jgi:hypothetical protein
VFLGIFVHFAEKIWDNKKELCYMGDVLIGEFIIGVWA